MMRAENKRSKKNKEDFGDRVERYTKDSDVTRKERAFRRGEEPEHHSEMGKSRRGKRGKGGSTVCKKGYGMKGVLRRESCERISKFNEITRFRIEIEKPK